MITFTHNKGNIPTIDAHRSIGGSESDSYIGVLSAAPVHPAHRVVSRVRTVRRKVRVAVVVVMIEV